MEEIVGAILPTVDPTPTDFVTAVTTAFADYAPALLAVGAVGLGIAVVKWGFPVVVGFFKKTAK